MTSNKAMPGIWLAMGALFALIATIVIVRGDRQPLDDVPATAVS